MLKDFFPTPDELTKKMLDKVKFGEVKNILEPSAGKGNILDYIWTYETVYERRSGYEYKHQNKRQDFNVDTIEIDNDLRHILKGKNYNVIHDDFLTFHTHRIYDLIIANFPFSEAEHHLRKALSMIAENGGHLVCLVNAETIRNPYTRNRKECVELIRDFSGSIEFLEGEFENAERKTNVEVALIDVKIDVLNEDSLILDKLTKAKDETGELNPSAEIVEMDFYKQMIQGFEMECRAGVALIDEYLALKPYILDRFKKPGESDYSKPLIQLEINGKSSYQTEDRPKAVNAYVRGVRYKYWQLLIKSETFSGRYTTDILNSLDAKLHELKGYDFTLFNIQELQADLDKRINKGIEDAILKLFDYFSARYSWSNNPYETNVHYYNGWKTNKSWKINEKVILPMNGIGSVNYTTKHRELDSWRIKDTFTDMVKVFNILAQLEHKDAYQLVGRQIEFANQRRDYNLDLRYFEVKFYKKGTVHIKFTDKKLLDKLNIYGSQKKNWLPPNYGKVPYEEFDAESRAVVDEFQGRESYNEVFAKQDFYLLQPAQLQLTANL